MITLDDMAHGPFDEEEDGSGDGRQGFAGGRSGSGDDRRVGGDDFGSGDDRRSGDDR